MDIVAKQIFFFILLFLNWSTVIAQKPIIGTDNYENWPSLSDNPLISNDGNYAAYGIKNQPVGHSTLIVQSIHNDWKKEITDVNSGEVSFTQDCKFIAFKTKGDSLCLWKLKTEEKIFIANVRSFELRTDGKYEWLLYQLKNLKKELICRQIQTGKEQSFLFVTDYLFRNDGKVLVLQTEIKEDTLIKRELQWVTIEEGKINTIWSSMVGNNNCKASGVVFDEGGKHLAFIEEKRIDGRLANTIWYYQEGMDKAVMQVNDQSPGIGSALSIDKSGLKFSRNGNQILFRLIKKKDTPSTKKDLVKVDVWNYKDSKLQSVQLKELNYYQSRYLAAISINESKVIQIEYEGDGIVGESSGDYILLKNQTSNSNEWKWNLSDKPSFYLVSVKNGTRKLLKEQLADKAIEYTFQLSPHGKYVVYYDRKQNSYVSYETATGILQKIAKDIKVPLTYENYDYTPAPPPLPSNGIVGWLSNDSTVFIHDNYDIWQVDMHGAKPSINITHGYGRKHHIEFLLTKNENTSIRQGEKLILAAFNTETKENGFYLVTQGITREPERLTMGPYLYHWPFLGSTFSPIKAKDEDLYLVQRESAIEAPNYYLTKDFITYSPLSDIQPHKKFNWLTSEIVQWKTIDGQTSKGVLYKPENFDPSKKYPIIFEFYEKKSNNLHKYLIPENSQAEINIPYFVSNGYLVFTPDIQFIIGNIGQSAYNSIVSAAQHLSKIPWVGAKKMGIDGHSFGGYEVNYLVTKTKLFSAAISASGLSNLISFYGTILGNGVSAQYLCETDQLRIGPTLWERPDMYIKNSPIFKADKVTTPLLIMSNKGDVWNLFSQGAEYFTALRRLGKKAWMLQYDKGGHSVSGEDAKDFTIRMQQFFNHYLKSAPAPIWMTQGVPAKLKGIEMGYALDPSGNCGKDCKVCKTWNERWTNDSVATKQLIEKEEKNQWMGL